MPSHHAQQKKIEKHKKKRAAAQKASHASSASNTPASAAIIRLAASRPFGPAFMSMSWREASAAVPALVAVVITRDLGDGCYLPAICLVDRTCLGVKNAFVAVPMSRAKLSGLLDQSRTAAGDELEEVSVLEAHSVLFHAIDYARSLGFSPHRDFPAEVVGQRPLSLLDTPLAHPARPIYVPGPADDIPRITRMLAAAEGQPTMLE